MDLDPGPGTQMMSPSAGRDMFIQKFDSQGNLIWAQHWSHFEDVTSLSLASDASGGVYVTGAFRGNTFDADPSSSFFNLYGISDSVSASFLLKLNVSGNFEWAVAYKGGNATFAPPIINSNGEVAVCLTYTDSIDVNPHPILENYVTAHTSGKSDMLVQKFDSTGTLQFSKFFSGSGNINPAASAIDSKDDILISGEINSGSIDLNPDSNAVNNRARNSGLAKGFILRLSSSGNYLNSVVNEGAGLNFYTDMAVDHNDDYYLAGYYDGTFDLAPGSTSQPVTHRGSYQEGACYQKFSSSDIFLWGTNHPTTLFRNTPSFFQRAKIAVDGQSHFAYLGGFFIDSVFFEPNKVNGLLLGNTGRSDQRDSYVMKIDPANDSIYWTYSPYERYSRNDFYLTNISAELDELYFAGSIRGEHRFDGPNSPLKGSDREMQLVFASLKSCIPNPSQVTVDSTACIPFTDPNGIVYSFPGKYQYTQSYDNRFGCDSLNITVRLNLRGAAMPQISQYWWGLEIPAPAAHHTAQWYDCSNGQVLVGDTNALFYPPADGSYALIYGDTSACTADTSQCFTFANVRQNEFNHHQLSIYPNPAQNKLMLESGELEVQNLAIIDSRGTRHKTQKIAYGLDISSLSPGVYILELQTNKGALRKRFVKI